MAETPGDVNVENIDVEGVDAEADVDANADVSSDVSGIYGDPSGTSSGDGGSLSGGTSSPNPYGGGGGGGGGGSDPLDGGGGGGGQDDGSLDDDTSSPNPYTGGGDGSPGGNGAGGGGGGGQGDEVNLHDDPDTGSTTTDRLRDDAESDPMNGQTERVNLEPRGGGRGGQVDGDRVRRRSRAIYLRDWQSGGGGRGGGVDTDQVRRNVIGRRVRGASGGGGRAGGVTSADAAQAGRNVIAGRVGDASRGGGGRAGGVTSRDVAVTQAGGGPRPGDITAEPGGITIPVPGDGPRPGPDEGLEDTTAGEDAPIFVIDDPRPNREEFRGTKPEIARLIESVVLEDERTLDRDDISVFETDDGLGVAFTFGGIQEQWQVGSVSRSIGQGFAADRATTARLDLLGRLDEAVETRVSSERNVQTLDVAGGPSPGGVRVSTVTPADLNLVRGVDYTVGTTFGQPGTLTTELTPSRRREEAAFGFEQQLANAGQPVDLDPERDIVLTASGARLSEEGEITVETSDAGPLQSNIPITSLRVIGPGAFGAALVDRQRGEIPIPIGPPGSDLRVPLSEDAEALAARGARAYTERVSEPAAEATPRINEVTLTSIGGAGAAAGRGELPVPLLPPGLEQRNVDVPRDVSTFGRAEVRAAAELGNLPSTAGTTIDVLEFGRAGTEATAAGNLGISYEPGRTETGLLGQEVARPIDIVEGGFAETAGQAGVRAAENVAEYARENPVEFSGQVAGSLAASAAIMGGAASLSRGAGFASRVAIQPGEEILGYGGGAITRRVAGPRAAQRLFPNNEPLIFSEEAAIRAGLGVARRTRAAGGRARGRATDIVLGEPGTRIERQESTFEGFENARLVTERPGVRSRVWDIFGGTDRGQLGPSKNYGSRGLLETETEDPREITADDIAAPLGRPRQEPLTTVTADAELRAERDPVTNPMRERARAATESELDVRGETEQARRAESALSVFGTAPLAMQGLGVEQLSIADTELAQEPAAGTDIIAETRTGLGLELAQETGTESFLGFDLELEFETEFETELEAEAEERTEIELESQRDDTRRDPDEVILGPRPTWTRRVERDLINPITGE